MPKGTSTALFVSSTCYDLGQVRADLRDFSLEVGLEPVLSEFDSFPVNPSTDAISSCLQAVRDRADIFVLVIGGRYGSVTDAGLSVTNLEFLEATAKGVPTYVFVKTEILTVLPLWKANPTADFSSTVDSTKLFEFVETLRNKQNLWVFPFKNAQDIRAALRKQISYLLADCLATRARLYPPDPALESLGPEALRIYLEKPDGWEYLALAKSLQESVRSHFDRKLDLEIGITFEQPIHLGTRTEALRWVGKKMGDSVQIAQHLSRTLNDGVGPAVGPPGVPGDIVRIAHLGRRFGDAYRRLIDWSLEFRRVVVDSELDRLMKLGAGFTLRTLEQIEEFSESLYQQILDSLRTAKPGDHLTFALKIDGPDLTEFRQELDRLSNLAQ